MTERGRATELPCASKLPRIAVCSIDALGGAIAQWNPDVVISVFSPSPRLRVSQFQDRRHLLLLFHDIDSAGFIESFRSSRASRLVVGCREQHIQSFFHFLKEKPERLLIHCVAGLSRSPALAILAICAIHGDIIKACAAVKRAIPFASPNRRVLALGDGALNLGGRLIEEASLVFPDRDLNHARSGFVELDLCDQACGNQKI
jgi:predicted protein tyrosine phosphatase